MIRGTFRVRGDTLEIFPAYEEIAVRVEFFGDEVERIVEVDPLTGELLVERLEIDIYPAKHFVTTADKLALAIKDIQPELEERLTRARGRRQDRWKRPGFGSARCTTWRCCRRPAIAPASRTIRCTSRAASQASSRRR